MRPAIPRMRTRLLRTGVATLSVVVVIGVLGQADGYPVSDHPMDSGGAWFASLAVGKVTLIDGPSKQVVTEVGVAEPGASIGAVQARSGAYIADRTTGAVLHVDGATYTASDAVQLIAGAGPGLEVFAGDQMVFVLDRQRGAVAVADPTLRRWQPPASLAASVSDGTVDRDGRLWILDGASGDLITLDGDGRTSIDGLVDPAGAGLELAGDRIAVVDQGARAIHAVDPASREVVAEVCLDVAAGDPSVRVSGSPDAPRVYAVSGQRGVLLISDLATGDCSQIIQVAEPGAALGVPQEAGGRVFVPNLTTGQVHIVDLNEREVTATADLFDTATEFELLARSGIVFYNDPGSQRAGVIDLDGTVHPVDKYRPDRNGERGSGAAGDGDGENADNGDRGRDGDGQDREDGDRAGDGDRGNRPDRLRPQDLAAADPGAPVDLPDLGLPPTNTTGIPPSGASPDGSAPVVSGDPPGGEVPPAGEPSERTAPQITGIAPSGAVDVGREVTFTATVAGVVDGWQWQVSGPGDPGSSDAAQLTHTFSQAGDHTVTVTAANALGSDTLSITVPAVTAVQAPTGTVTCNSGPIEVGDTLQCSYVSLGDDPPDTYAWELSGPETASSTTSSLSHPLGAAGDYQVSLVASNAGGDDSQTVNVTVAEAPQPPAITALNCSTNPAPPQVGGSVTCSAQTTGDVEGMEWSWVPPSSGAWQNERDTLSETFTEPGNHRVAVIVYRNGEEQDRRERTFTVPAPPEPPDITSVTCTSPGSHGSTAFFSGNPMTCSVDVDGDVDTYRWLMSGGHGGEQTTQTFDLPALPDVPAGVPDVGHTVEVRVGNAAGEDRGAFAFTLYPGS